MRMSPLGSSTVAGAALRRPTSLTSLAATSSVSASRAERSVRGSFLVDRVLAVRAVVIVHLLRRSMLDRTDGEPRAGARPVHNPSDRAPVDDSGPASSPACPASKATPGPAREMAQGNAKVGPPEGGPTLTMFVRRRPTLPQPLGCSTIGAERLNFRVRYGTGCFPFRYGRRNSFNSTLPVHRPTPRGVGGGVGVLVGNCLVDANMSSSSCDVVCVRCMRVCGLVRGWDKPSAY